MTIEEVINKVRDIDHVINNLDELDALQYDAINLLQEYRTKILDTVVNI